MSKRLRNMFGPLAAMVGLLAFAMATPARADSLDIWISTVNNPPVAGDQVASASSGTSVAYSNNNFGGFSISMLASSSNSPGTSSNAQLTGATLSITNNNSKTATLYISLGDGGFTSPTTPPNLTLLSHVGGTVVIGSSANLLTYHSYVNSDNSQNGTTGITPGAQTPGITSGSFNSDASTPITSLSGPYSMTETFAFTLGAGAEINFSSSTTLSPVPEPTSLSLAALGALGLTGYSLRRRKV
jgi:hypothetical protein